MAKLTQAQIAMYAQAAGMANPQLAAAVAMAESGGETTSHNPVPPDNSYGLWQINMLGSMGPDRRRSLGITSNNQLFDPAINARAAAMISSGGTNFTPWSTYTNGAYKKYLNGGVTQAGLSTLPGDVVEGAKSVVGGVTDGLNGIQDGIEAVLDAGNWLSNPRNWLRIAYVVIGGGIALVGLSVMLQTNALGKVAGALGGDSSGGAKSAAAIGKVAVTKGKSAQAEKPTPKAAPKPKAAAKAAAPKPKAAKKAAAPQPEAAA